jgi:DNA mismatch repair ATPase MutS
MMREERDYMEELRMFNDVEIKKTYRINIGDRIQMNEDVLGDVEMCETFSDSRSVADEVIDFSHFPESRTYINEILSFPVNDKCTLNMRQNYFKRLDHTIIGKQLYQIKDRFQSIKWLCTQRDKEVEKLLNSVYFSWLVFRLGNESSLALTYANVYAILLSPTIGILSPIMYVILPYLVLKYKYKIQVPFKLYVETLYNVSISSLRSSNDSNILKSASYLSFASTIFFYFHGTIQSVYNSQRVFGIVRLIKNHMTNICKSYKMYKTLLHNSMLEINPFYDFTGRVNIPSLESKVNTCNSRILGSNFGMQLKMFKSLNNDESKLKLNQIMNQVFILDALCALKYYIKTKNLARCSFDFESENPYIIFKNSWHPNLSNCAVRNTFENVNTEKKHTIITGPNASGKSTFIKGVLINIILSQTLGYNATTRTIITPFDFIGSLIHIPDCKGKESLFEAEMVRCKKNFDFMISERKKKCILFMDEIFNSTNFIEGYSGAYSILEKMGRLNNCILFVTTHYPSLSKLNTDNNYSLKKFDCKKENGKIKYDYKLKNGVCDEYVALDILLDSGFDSEIIRHANQIKERLISKNSLNFNSKVS